MEQQNQVVEGRKSSVKMSLRFVKERYEAQQHLDSLAQFKDNVAGKHNMFGVFINKIVKELGGQFETGDNPRQSKHIVFKDGSKAKNPLYRETLTHRIARELGQV